MAGERPRILGVSGICRPEINSGLEMEWTPLGIFRYGSEKNRQLRVLLKSAVYTALNFPQMLFRAIISLLYLLGKD